MKKAILLIMATFLSRLSYSQNLVPNFSFEDTISCPYSVTQIYKAQNWYAFRESPDYFHECCNILGGPVGEPTNFIGFQYPHSGKAYAGIIAYDLTGAPGREYLAVQLVSPTIVNQKYFATFYVSWAGALGFTIAINKLGISLTNGFYSFSNPYPITNNPKAYSDSIYRDSVGWSKIQLSFLADSAYSYLIIGDFFDDANTDTLNLGQFNQHCYYYIDDVCLSLDSPFCSNITSLPEMNNYSHQSLIENCFIKNNVLTIIFNPILKEKEIFIYSEIGQLITQRKTINKEINLKMPSSNSLYLLNVISNNKLETKKIISNLN